MQLLAIGWALANSPEEEMLMDRLDQEDSAEEVLASPYDLVDEVAGFFHNSEEVGSRLIHFLERVGLMYDDWLLDESTHPKESL